MANETAAARSDLHREITAEQNVKWAERIRTMPATDDVEFVSLDIGYLGGLDNVLSRLQAEGHRCKRVR